jgi:outer membrane protein assembly factor BamA
MKVIRITKKWLWCKLLLAFYLLITADLSSQENLLPIGSIVVIGNETTGENVILRELLFSKGDLPDSTHIERSRQRILGLSLFNRVQIHTVPGDRETIIIIEVTERLYFYPEPIFFLTDRDWGKISYGLGLTNYNFRGQNEKLTGAVWFGYRPGFGFAYSDQWMGEQLHLTSGFSSNMYTTNHRTLDFLEERHLTGTIKIGKFWNRYFKTEINLDFDRIRVDKQYTYLMHSGKSMEQLWGIIFYVRYDTRDLRYFPGTGWLTSFSFLQNNLFQRYNNYNRTIIDLRRYNRLGPLIVTGRFYQNYLFGQVPIYRANYIGFSERIRGHFYEVYEGRHIHMGSAEIRFPIIPVKYFTMDFPGLPDLYQSNLKVGLSGEFFIDSGIIWQKSADYRMHNYITGFGCGLFLHLPYVEIFRIDYGLNLDFQGEWIFEVGVYF